MGTGLRAGSLIMAILCMLMGLAIAIPSTLLVVGGLMLDGRLNWSVVPFAFGVGLAAMGAAAVRLHLPDR
jgi:hypothetical protein